MGSFGNVGGLAGLSGMKGDPGSRSPAPDPRTAEEALRKQQTALRELQKRAKLCRQWADTIHKTRQNIVFGLTFGPPQQRGRLEQLGRMLSAKERSLDASLAAGREVAMAAGVAAPAVQASIAVVAAQGLKGGDDIIGNRAGALDLPIGYGKAIVGGTPPSSLWSGYWQSFADFWSNRLDIDGSRVPPPSPPPPPPMAAFQNWGFEEKLAVANHLRDRYGHPPLSKEMLGDKADTLIDVFLRDAIREDEAFIESRTRR